MIIKGINKTIAETSYSSAGWVGALLGVLLSVTLTAQGWQYSFGGDKTDEAFALIESIDQGYVTVGVSESFGADNDPDIFVVRTDIDGTLVWRKEYDLGFRETGTDIVRTANGTYLVTGTSVLSNGDDSDILLLEISAEGRLLWSKILDEPLDQKVSGITLAANGDMLIVGEEFDPDAEDSDFLYARFDAAGDLIWKKTSGTDRTDGLNAAVTLDGDFVLTGVSKNEEGPDNDLVALRIDGDGNILWENRLSGPMLEEGRDVISTRDGQIAIGGLINDQQDGLVVKLNAETGDTLWSSIVGEPNLEDGLNALVELSNGDLAGVGFQVQADGIDVGVLVARLTGDGEVLFTNRLGDQQYLDEGRDLVETSNGDLVIAGYNGFELTFFNDVILLKTDANGNAFSNILTGRVYWDEDEQCDVDAGEPGLSNWLVQAEGKNKTYYGSTDRNGFYNILVDTGDYNVQVIPLNQYWESCLADGVPLRLQAFYDTIRTDFGVRAQVECPLMELNVSAPYLVRCSEVPYTVRYQNLGTAPATNVQVELLLDPVLSFQSAGVEPAGNEGNVLTFNVGTVAPGESGSFEVIASSACDGIAIDQAVNVTANITPDTLCLMFDPDWDRSDLEVSGQCEGDSIAFSIINIGIQDMITKRASIVIQDDIIVANEPLQLKAQEERRIKVPANGSTYRVFAQESANHPFSNYATTAVEGCTEDGSSFSVGQVTQFPEDDRMPSRSINVQEVKEEAPQVALTAHPQGYRGTFIDASDPVKYKVVFTNTGADTVDRVVIRDTVPEGLNVEAVTFGASSHPYKAEVYEDGIFKITFTNLSLPPLSDSTTVASRGYIEYEVAQTPDNLTGTTIENRLRVFFDYQEPVLSNTVTRTVGTFPGYVEVTSVEQPDIPGLNVQVYPNPLVELVTFDVSGYNVTFLDLMLYDIEGRLVRRERSRSSQVELNRNQLPEGVYVFRLESDGVLLATGKLIVQ